MSFFLKITWSLVPQATVIVAEKLRYHVSQSEIITKHNFIKSMIYYIVIGTFTGPDSFFIKQAIGLLREFAGGTFTIRDS
ncbi:hypothetical protein KQX54_015081 [Cotesia glomerata]|uniref:Uncharacterized protein n=1 Tax=Cotesia glomerata TaxID=32391 RepID=A0AAV7I1I3_COTGL|nr:hypothetical protein KQX54_015081 [Cotesia glomerata]